MFSLCSTFVGTFVSPLSPALSIKITINNSLDRESPIFSSVRSSTQIGNLRLLLEHSYFSLLTLIFKFNIRQQQLPGVFYLCHEAEAF